MVDVHDLVVRLREEAQQRAPGSDGWLLLREAASSIERLDEQARLREAGAPECTDPAPAAR